MYFILKTHTALDISVSFDLQRVVGIEKSLKVPKLNDPLLGCIKSWWIKYEPQGEQISTFHCVSLNGFSANSAPDPSAHDLRRSGPRFFQQSKPDRPLTHLTSSEPTRRSHVICDDLLWLSLMKRCVQGLLPAQVRSRCLWVQPISPRRRCVQRFQQQHLVCNQPPPCVDNIQPFSLGANKHELKLACFSWQKTFVQLRSSADITHWSWVQVCAVLQPCCRSPAAAGATLTPLKDLLFNS